jgi:hypothetical protein
MTGRPADMPGAEPGLHGAQGEATAGNRSSCDWRWQCPCLRAGVHCREDHWYPASECLPTVRMVLGRSLNIIERVAYASIPPMACLTPYLCAIRWCWRRCCRPSRWCPRGGSTSCPCRTPSPSPWPRDSSSRSCQGRVDGDNEDDHDHDHDGGGDGDDDDDVMIIMMMRMMRMMMMVVASCTPSVCPLSLSAHASGERQGKDHLPGGPRLAGPVMAPSRRHNRR